MFNPSMVENERSVLRVIDPSFLTLLTKNQTPYTLNIIKKEGKVNPYFTILIQNKTPDESEKKRRLNKNLYIALPLKSQLERFGSGEYPYFLIDVSLYDIEEFTTWNMHLNNFMKYIESMARMIMPDFNFILESITNKDNKIFASELNDDKTTKSIYATIMDCDLINSRKDTDRLLLKIDYIFLKRAIGVITNPSGDKLQNVFFGLSKSLSQQILQPKEQKKTVKKTKPAERMTKGGLTPKKEPKKSKKSLSLVLPEEYNNSEDDIEVDILEDPILEAEESEVDLA